MVSPCSEHRRGTWPDPTPPPRLLCVYAAVGCGSRRDLHLQIIYFGREHCPAKAHDPTGCPICSWAAVPPYDR